jgi:hypothetical protein
MEKTGRDKRLSPRVPLQSPLRYRIIPMDSAGFRNAAVQDVSLTGFRFHSQEFIPNNSGFLLEMNVPGQSPVRSLARAVWVRERPGDAGYVVGGMFVEPPSDVRATLSQLVAKR